MNYRKSPLARRAALAAFVVIIASVVISTPRAASLADYGGYRPHYQGFGTNTSGGRGGTIIRVTNLNDSGTGSLRAALEARGPRIVVFEVSGTISLSYDITITNPYLTVAGQTAPNPGITVRYHPINVDTHDVVFQHIRMRMGDSKYSNNSGSNVFRIRTGAYNVVLDHMSLSWGMGSILAVSSNDWQGVSILDSVIAYNLRIAPSETGMAALNAYSWIGEVTYARNLFVHNSNRSPWIGAGTRASVFNNVVYGSGNSGGDPTTQFGFLQLMVANYTWEGMSNQYWNAELVAQNNRFIGSYNTGSGLLAGTHSATRSVDVVLDGYPASLNSRMYLSGNIGPRMTLDNQWGGVDFLYDGNRAMIEYPSVPSWHASFAYDMLSPTEVVPSVLRSAGARPNDRDFVDQMAVSHTTAGLAQDVANMGSRISSQNDMGGWPTLAVNYRPLSVPANPNSVAPGESFRTNVEVWLESYAKSVEQTSAISQPTGVVLTK